MDNKVLFNSLSIEEKEHIKACLDTMTQISNNKIKITFHTVQRCQQRGISRKAILNMIKTKNYFIYQKQDNKVIIISKAPLRNELHLKLVIDYENSCIITAIVTKINYMEVAI